MLKNLWTYVRFLNLTLTDYQLNNKWQRLNLIKHKEIIASHVCLYNSIAVVSGGEVI